MIKIKIKRIGKDAKLPQKQKEGDAGYDCFIRRFKDINIHERSLCDSKYNKVHLHSFQRIVCMLGFATEIPDGYYAQVVSRSGLALWNGIIVINTPGTIDSGYRNEWTAIIVNISTEIITLNIGDRICQIIFRKLVDVEFEEVKELNDSERGLNGLGSTGR